MPAALRPDLALQYLSELSTDIRAAVVLDADGRRLAGPERMHSPARDLLEASDAAQIEVQTGRGCVFAARDDRHALVVATGRLALPALVLYDLRMVLGDLAGPQA